jgi:hypothetical protein
MYPPGQGQGALSLPVAEAQMRTPETRKIPNKMEKIIKKIDLGLGEFFMIYSTKPFADRTSFLG